MANETVQLLDVDVRVRCLVTGSDGAKMERERTYRRTFSDGTGQNQCGTVWNDDARSLAATTETLDLDGLTDFKGAVATDVNAVKLIMIQNTETATGKKLIVGGGDWAGSTQMLLDATDKLNIGPDGLLLWVSPVDGGTVTATSADGLLLDSGANTVGFSVLLGLDNA